MESAGRRLRAERELRGMSLEEVASGTRIPLRVLERIEADRFDELPADVFARGYLRAYARLLGIDPAPVLALYERSRAPAHGSGLPPGSVLAQPERGARFGVAIVVVILLILFTLALSIVLQPRQRETPYELSRAAGAPRPPTTIAIG
ncbi:MAG: helix-turn-helix domain-containing protein [Myxococcota bacterium]|nr:helix-turn-helix domain-containing protein [Myxococcota bacterium]MDW8360804.1 helix-turn-helix domain-containing protein [Myxococcales bacterium]